jgi:hypothetical protein
MNNVLENLRTEIVQEVLRKQDPFFRWGYDEQRAQAHPEYVDYSPTFRSTWWTLILLADIQAPPAIPQVRPSLEIVVQRFYDQEHGISRLPGMSHFPIPCLNGNMLYLLQYFQAAQQNVVGSTVQFFARYQRFDDGGFKTPSEYPYYSNTSCYGKHTCYWGVTKLLKGLSFIPKEQRTAEARQLIDQCVEFILLHEVCFASHKPDAFIHAHAGKLTFPNFYKSDFLEVLWLLAREAVRDKRLNRAVELLHSRRRADGTWGLERHANTIVPVGRIGLANDFITDRAIRVLDFYGG